MFKVIQICVTYEYELKKILILYVNRSSQVTRFNNEYEWKKIRVLYVNHISSKSGYLI